MNQILDFFDPSPSVTYWFVKIIVLMIVLFVVIWILSRLFTRLGIGVDLESHAYYGCIFALLVTAGITTAISLMAAKYYQTIDITLWYTLPYFLATAVELIAAFLLNQTISFIKK